MWVCPFVYVCVFFAMKTCNVLFEFKINRSGVISAVGKFWYVRAHLQAIDAMVMPSSLSCPLRHQCRGSLHQRSGWCWTSRPLASEKLERNSPDRCWFSAFKSKIVSGDVSCNYYVLIRSCKNCRFVRLAHPCAAKEWNAQFAMSAWEGRVACWKNSNKNDRLLSWRVSTSEARTDNYSFRRINELDLQATMLVGLLDDVGLSLATEVNCSEMHRLGNLREMIG